MANYVTLDKIFFRGYLPAASRNRKRATGIEEPSGCTPDTAKAYVPGCSALEGMATLIESGEFGWSPSCLQISFPWLPITEAR